MKKGIAVLALMGCATFYAAPSQAVIISLDPTAQVIGVGGTATVDLNISDLGDLAAPSLGAFFVEINFNGGIVAFNSAAYGALLGDPSDPFETDIVTTPGAGLVTLDEVSFLLDFELNALQPSSFTLATLTFMGIAPGLSPLSFGTVDLSDAVFPANTIVPTNLIEASIQVTGVPEPGTMLLLVPGLTGLLLWRRRQRTRPRPKGGITPCAAPCEGPVGSARETP